MNELPQAHLHHPFRVGAETKRTRHNMQSLQTNLFLSTDYLQFGTPKQQELAIDLENWKILKSLHGFKPTLAGTIPLDIDTDSSDVDILVKFNIPAHLQKICYAKFRNLPNYSFSEKTIALRVTLICRFETKKFQYEIFGQSVEPTEQYAWIHMMVENRFLILADSSFRDEIRNLKKQGIKTEAAFCKVLDLKGDPYKTLVQWNQKSNEQFRELLLQRGYQINPN
ncbi:uncharacterized protein DUF4269 [Leptospira meyeri]|uniref:Uncharacterized protein DUF4269 n=2 Tax=Leptospira meyeri TaxID=29508 RepID=A0A4V3HIX1_LEPME|nr:uncharacterized protein DUF4269 [Leptospira meyeri]